MTIRLYKRDGSPHWWIRGSVCGQSVYRSTKLTDKKLAEALRAKVERDMAVASVFGEEAVKTFDDAAEAYLLAGGSPRYLDRIRGKFGATLMKDIKQPDVDRAARQAYPGVSASTLIRQFYTPFVAVWNFAVENEWARHRKWRRPRKAKDVASQKKAGTFPVDYEHAAEFVEAMSPAPAMLMTALFYTGMRPIELFSLTAQDINIAGRWITLRKSKTGEPRGIPVHEFLVPLLTALVARGGEVFRTHKGSPYVAKVDGDGHATGGGQLKTALIGARRRSGIDDISPYTARHTVSTGLVMAGVHSHMKDQILGHAADSMSRHYTNVPQAPLIEAINKLPVPDKWASIEWWSDPLAWSRKLHKKMGRRTDLGGGQ